MHQEVEIAEHAGAAAASNLPSGKFPRQFDLRTVTYNDGFQPTLVFRRGILLSGRKR